MNEDATHPAEKTEEILGNLAHKLRTPITQMKWNIAAILDDTAGPLNDAQRTAIELLRTSVEHLVEIVDTIAPQKS